MQFTTYSGHSESHFAFGAAFTRIPKRRTDGGERRRVAVNVKRLSLNPRSLHDDWLRPTPSLLLIGRAQPV